MSLATTTTPQPAFIYLTAYLGPGDASRITTLIYQSDPALTASISNTISEQLAASATSQSFNLSTIFGNAPSSPLFVSITETTTPGVGFYITSSSGVGKFPVAPNGVFLVTASAALALPTVYIDNPSSTSVLNLSFGLLGA